MVAQGKPKLIDPDAEELVFKLRFNSIPCREVITSLNADNCGDWLYTENSMHMYHFIWYQFY